MSNSIAQFQFIRLTPAPILPAKEWQREARAGVTGVTLFDTASRAEPWQPTSIVDCVDLATAASLYNQYLELVNSDNAVPVVYAGLVSPLNYKAIGVIVKRMSKTAGGVGGISGISNAILECNWTLQAIGP